MFERIILIEIADIKVFAYGVWLALSAAICFALAYFRARKRGILRDAMFWFTALAISLGAIFGHWFYCLIRYEQLFAERDTGLFFRPWEGGFGLSGIFAGVALSAFVAARVSRIRISKLADVLAPPAALMICLARLGEWLDGAGYGDYIENASLTFFPIGVRNVFGEYYFSVFLLEALVGLLIFLALFRIEKRAKLADGNLALLFISLFGASQMLLESLRRDLFLRFGFVRVGQLTGLALVLIALLILTNKLMKKTGLTYAILCDYTLMLLFTGVCVALEFAFDKAYFLPNWLGYIVMLFSVSGLAATVVSQIRKTEAIIKAGD